MVEKRQIKHYFAYALIKVQNTYQVNLHLLTLKMTYKANSWQHTLLIKTTSQKKKHVSL